MGFFFVDSVSKCLSAPQSRFARTWNAAIVRAGVYCVVPLLGSILPGAIAQDVPTGFTVDRYVGLWEHNPFVLVKPAAPERPPPAFEKLFLASWLNDGGIEMVLVQNSETNEVQRITAVPNQNNLRLVQIHPDPNPQLVDAVISNGEEHGTVKFRFDVPPLASQTSPASLSSSQGPGSPPLPTASQITMRRNHAARSKNGYEGGPGPNSLKETRGKRSPPSREPHS